MTQFKSGNRTFSSAQEFKLAIMQAIAQSTAFAKIKLIDWSLTDHIPRGGIIPVDTGFMMSTNFGHILMSGQLGEMDLIVHFDTFYAGFVNEKPSQTGSQGYFDRVKPKVIALVREGIRQGFQNMGIEVVV